MSRPPAPGWAWGRSCLCSGSLKVSSNSMSALSSSSRERWWDSKACLSGSNVRLSCHLLRFISFLCSLLTLVLGRIGPTQGSAKGCSESRARPVPFQGPSARRHYGLLRLLLHLPPVVVCSRCLHVTTLSAALLPAPLWFPALWIDPSRASAATRSRAEAS